MFLLPIENSDVKLKSKSVSVEVTEKLDDSGKTKCQYCFKSFNHPYNLSLHANSCKIFHQFMEENENGFKCKICRHPTTILTRATMRQHLRTKHEDIINAQENSCKKLKDRGMSFFLNICPLKCISTASGICLHTYAY